MTHERVVDIARALMGAEARGYAVAKEQAAKVVDCACKDKEQVLEVPPNSGARWALCGEANCSAIIAAEIRAMEMSDE